MFTPQSVQVLSSRGTVLYASEMIAPELAAFSELYLPARAAYYKLNQQHNLYSRYKNVGEHLVHTSSFGGDDAGK